MLLNIRYLSGIISRSFFGIFLMIAAVFAANSQMRLSGTVVNQETSNPVAYAYVRAGDIATYTNSDGAFLIYVPENLQAKLEVFHIGFDTYRDDLQEDKPYRIALKPLGAVVVEPDTFSVEKIMQQVYLRFLTNYEYKDQLVSSYYKEKLTGDDELYYFAEGVLDLYLPSDVHNAAPLVRPVKSRINYRRPYPRGSIDLRASGATEMVQSSIRVDNSFLAPKNRWNYTYSLAGREIHRDANVFVIDFKPANSNGYLSGRIFVDEVFYGIVRLEYSYVKEPNKKWTEEFEFMNGSYYLVRTVFEGQWEAKGTSFAFSSMLVNTKIETDQEENIDLNRFVSGKSAALADPVVGTFSRGFWASENHVLLDKEEEMSLMEE